MILRFFPLLFTSCYLWGLTDGETWAGRFQESSITLNTGNTINITLDRDPNVNQSQANDFGSKGGTNLNLTSNGGQATLTLKKKDSLSNMQFYHKSGNTISVSQNAHLTISLGSHSNSSNIFLLSGGLIQVANGGKWTLSGAYRLSIGSDGGKLVANQGGSVEAVWVTEVKIVTKKGRESGIINNGGDIVLKTEYGVYNSSFNTDPNYQQGSSDSAGVITHNSGTTTIRHREDGKESLLYNAGYQDFGSATSKNRYALLEVNGGEFNVIGNLYNGGKMGGSSGGAGVGWIIGKGGVINVSNTLYNYSLDSSLPSKINLENTTIKTNTLFNRANGEIYLKDKAHIQATTFTSDANSKIFFIGSGDGFGSISAQNLALNGEEIFQAGLLNPTKDYKYLIATSPNTTGFQLGAIALQDIDGQIANRYSAKLVQEGDKTYIQLTPNSTINPPIPPTPNPDPTPPTQTPSPSAPQYISNLQSIQDELDKHFLILTQNTLQTVSQDILSQIEQLQSFKKITTYAISNLYNRSIQSQISNPTPHLAYNPYTIPLSNTQNDFLPIPLLEEKKSYSAYINFIGGIFGYENNIGGNYGANFGIDGFVNDSLFLGGYGVILGKTLNQEELKMQGLQAEIGGYARYLLSSWEFDTTLSYTLLHNNTQRAFTLYSQTFTQEASYNTHFFNLEERVGYRFSLTSTDTLKPYAGVGLRLYFQPSYNEDGDFAYKQSGFFYGSFEIMAGLEYRKNFSFSSLYLTSSLGYQIPSFGENVYSLHFLDSLLYFQNSPIFTAQIQGGMDFSITPNSFLSIELNYQYTDTKYFDMDAILGYRYLF